MTIPSLAESVQVLAGCVWAPGFLANPAAVRTPQPIVAGHLRSRSSGPRAVALGRPARRRPATGESAHRVPTVPPHSIRWFAPLPVSMGISAPRDVWADDKRGAQRRSGCACRLYGLAKGRGLDWRASVAFCSAGSRVGTADRRVRPARQGPGSPGVGCASSAGELRYTPHPRTERGVARHTADRILTESNSYSLQEGQGPFRLRCRPALIPNVAVASDGITP